MEKKQSSLHQLDKPLHRRTWFQVVAGVLIMATVGVVALPYAISYGAKRWILANGGDRIRVTDVDFNLFTGTLVLEGMQVHVGDQTMLDIGRAVVQIAWRPLFKHRLHIRNVGLEQFSIAIERSDSGEIRVGGISLPEAKQEVDGIKAELPWGIGIDQVTLVDGDIRYSDPQLQATATINKLTLRGLADWAPEQAAALSLDGTFDGAAIIFEGAISPFSTKPGGTGQLSVSALQLEKFAVFTQPTLSAFAGALTIDSRVEAWQDKTGVGIKQEGMISLKQLKIATKTASLTQQNIEWNGSIIISAVTETGKVQLQADGALVLDKLAMTAEGGQLNLLSINSLRASAIEIKALDQIDIALINVNDLVLAEETAVEGDTPISGSLTRMPDLVITNIHYDSDSGLSIDSITETDVSAVIRRDSNGQWNAVRLIDVLDKLSSEVSQNEGHSSDKPATDQTIAEDTRTKHTPTKQAGIRIGKILAGGNNKLIFEDLAAKPAFRVTLNISKLEATDIDSSEPGVPSPLTIVGRVGKHTPFNITGTIKPFAEPAAYNLKGRIEALELPPLSSYTASPMGFEFDSGQLDADFSIKAEGGVLDGEVEFTIRQLELGSVDDAKLKEIESSLSVPLDVALSMLRDDNNSIHLKVPFSGQPDSPEFDLSDAINQAMVSALKQGAMTYLSMALQPYGALISLAKYAGEAATRLYLDPVEFEPGSAELDTTNFDYLKKVANILKERPELDIKICGAAVEADRQALAEKAAAEHAAIGTSSSVDTAGPPPVTDTKLVELAELRDDAVKDYLIAKHGVAAKHLIACEPNLDLKKADAKPRVDLLI